MFASVGSAIFASVYIADPKWQNRSSRFVSNISLLSIYFSNLSSFMHLVFIAIQRAIATIYPLKFKQISFGLRFFFVLILVWFFSAILISLVVFKLLSLGAIGYFGMTAFIAILILYVIICHQVIKQRKSISSTSRSGVQRSSFLVLFHSLAVTVTFVVCVVPAAIYAALQFPGGSPAFAAVTSLLVINPLLDPLVYFFVSHYRSKRRMSSQAATPDQRPNPSS